MKLFQTLMLLLILSTQAYAQDGALDMSFDPNPDGAINAIAVQNDGKILLGGSFTNIAGEPRNRIARLNTNGTVDTSFRAVDVNDQVFAIAVQSNGAIVLAGDFTMVDDSDRNGMARLDADGNLDENFNPSIIRAEDGDNVRALALQSNGQILIGGFFTTIGSTTRNYFARLDSSGSLDTGFNPAVDNSVRSILITPDNQILIGGNFATVRSQARPSVARLDMNANLDTSFDAPVKLVGSGSSVVFSLALQSDAKVVLGGNFNDVDGEPRNFLVRVNADGSLDEEFDANLNIVGFVNSVLVQADGKILVGGFFDVDGEPTAVHMVRFNNDGSLDRSFAANVNSLTNVIVVQPANDNILIGGVFTSVGETTRNNIARLDNTLPPAINFTSIASSQPEDIATAFSFVVTRDLPADGAASVDYVVSGGAVNPATADDFVGNAFPQGTLDFVDGQVNRTISIVVANDDLIEDDENFILALSNPFNLSLRSSLTVQSLIVNDDTEPEPEPIDDDFCLPIPIRDGKLAVVCF